MGKSRSKRSHTISGSSEVVNRGDSVFIRSSDPSVPYVARIEDIQVNKAGEVNVKLLWYYRPEDTEGGRKSFHGSKELFLSDHVEIQPADTIEGHCSVHTLEKYRQLKSIDACDYFTRFQYRSATGRFLPRHVDRYCNCEMPYNPDLPMIECESCTNWFHYSCLNIAAEGEETNFKCIKCTGKGQKVPHDASTKGCPPGGKVPDDTSNKGCPAHTDSDPFGGKIEAKLKVNEKHSDAGTRESVPVCLVKKEDAVELKRNLRDNRAETRHAPTDTVAADKRVALVYHDDMLNHTPPDKLANEKPERLVAIMERLRIEGLTERCHLFEPVLATKESLIKVHSEDLVNKVQSLSEEDFGFESSDIYYSQGSSRAAFLAAGGSILASDLVGRGDFQSAFAIVRPPGHHVLKDGPPRGFSLMNNVAAATSNLTNNHGKKKVLLLDWDIHHGDGTENIFYNENKVLFFSLHRFDKEFYPGTGSVDMIGGKDAVGYNINVCWEHKHIRDVDYIAAWNYLLLPLIQEFVPEVIMISAGFDAASGDPLGKCKVTSAGFRWLLEKLTPYPVVMVLEGGYHLDSLSESVASCVRILLGEKSGVGKSKSLPYASTWKMIKETREKLSPYWNVFREEIPDSVTSRCRQNP